MSGRQRALLIAMAAVIAVVAVVIIGSGGDDEKSSSTQAADTTGAKKATTAAPTVERLQVKGGKPVGAVKKIEVDKGTSVQILVSSDEPHELHLHGYDIERKVAPGKPAKFAFKANAEGIFE